MASHVLLVSNPPHTKLDALAAASVLGLQPVDANLKIRYSAPEIWLADTDRARIEAGAATLRQAGINCVVSSGEDLRDVPRPRLARGVTFSDDAVCVVVENQPIALAGDQQAVVVASTPRLADDAQQSGRVKVGHGAEVSDVCAFYDLFLPDRRRLSIYAELVDFAGLGERASLSSKRNMVVLGQLMRERLKHAQWDERLMNLQLRRRHWQPASNNPTEARKGYSFASPGLDELLDAIAPGLKEMTQPELSARLVYLTRR